jgi:hypothetical protein
MNADQGIAKIAEIEKQTHRGDTEKQLHENLEQPALPARMVQSVERKNKKERPPCFAASRNAFKYFIVECL